MPNNIERIREYAENSEKINLTNEITESRKFIDLKRAIGQNVLRHPPEFLLCDSCSKKIRDGVAVGSNTSIIQIQCKKCVVDYLRIIIQCAEADRVRVIFVGRGTAFLKPYRMGRAMRDRWYGGMPEWENYAKRCNLILFKLGEVTDPKQLIDLLYAELGMEEE